MFSGLSVNVNEFMDANKKIFLQFNAKSYTQDTALTLTLCMSIAAPPTPSKSIFNILMKKKVFLNLSKMQLLGQHYKITLLELKLLTYQTMKPLLNTYWNCCGDRPTLF